MFEAALKIGVPPRVEINSVDQAKYYLDLGVRHFSLGTDLAVLHAWWKQEGDALRKAISEA